MSIFLILCLLLQLSILNANPTPMSLYDAVAKECPIVSMKDVGLKQFYEQQVFKNCLNWTEIEQTKKLNPTNEQNVRCLLYFDSFFSFCKDLMEAKVNATLPILMPELKNYTTVNICKNMSLFPANKKFVHNVSQFINNDFFCYKLCGIYESAPATECSLAHYYANFNVTRLVLAQQTQAKILPPNAKENLNLTQEVPKLNGASPDLIQDDSPPKNVSEKDISGKEVHRATMGQFDATSLVDAAAGNSGKIGDVTLPQTKNNEENSGSSPGKLSTAEKTAAHITDSLTGASAGQHPVNENLEQLPGPEEAKKSQKNDEASPILSEQPENNLAPEKPEPEQSAGEVSVKDDVKNLEDGDSPQQQPIDTNKYEESEADVEDEEDQGDEAELAKVPAIKEDAKNEKPNTLTGDIPVSYNTTEELDGDSYFFSYFMVICVLFVLGYVGYHNRQKVMALVLEGKRGRRQNRGRRPNSANYHKLDSNLEEAISSTCTKNSSHVIY